MTSAKIYPGAVVTVTPLRRTSLVLHDLIVLAERVEISPHTAFGLAEDFARMRDALHMARTKQTFGAAFVGAPESVLLTALEEIAATTSNVIVGPWRHVVATMLPLVRADLVAALHHERSPS